MIKRESVFWSFLILVLFTLGTIFFASFSTRASSTPNFEHYPLEKGKNYILLESNFSAKQVIASNPMIETISYFDEGANSTLGVINIRGGIGRDFNFSKERVYEIHAKKAFNLTILK